MLSCQARSLLQARGLRLLASIKARGGFHLKFCSNLYLLLLSSVSSMMCDHVLQESQQSLSDTIEAQPTNDQRAVVLGVDRDGYMYIHFPLFCGADLRVYRQRFEEMTDSEPESLPVKVCMVKVGV